jgi:hypothetical protein
MGPRSEAMDRRKPGTNCARVVASRHTLMADRGVRAVVEQRDELIKQRTGAVSATRVSTRSLNLLRTRNWRAMTFSPDRFGGRLNTKS